MPLNTCCISTAESLAERDVFVKLSGFLCSNVPKMAHESARSNFASRKTQQSEDRRRYSSSEASAVGAAHDGNTAGHTALTRSPETSSCKTDQAVEDQTMICLRTLKPSCCISVVDTRN
jgi:hypothetical protein